MARRRGQVCRRDSVWAIGSGLVATPDSAQEAARAIREHLRGTFDDHVAASVRILYGGSVTSRNARELIDEPDVDGFLVGGASLDADEFAAIARIVEKSTRKGSSRTGR